jgi:hypothetical protein
MSGFGKACAAIEHPVGKILICYNFSGLPGSEGKMASVIWHKNLILAYLLLKLINPSNI